MFRKSKSVVKNQEQSKPVSSGGRTVTKSTVTRVEEQKCVSSKQVVTVKTYTVSAGPTVRIQEYRDAAQFAPKQTYVSPYGDRLQYTFAHAKEPNQAALYSAFNKLNLQSQVKPVKKAELPVKAPQRSSAKQVPSFTYQPVTRLPERANVVWSTRPTASSSLVLHDSVRKEVKVDKRKKPKGKGLMLIFNHVEYVNDKNKKRIGTEHDVKNLKQTFGEFRLAIEECRDYTIKKVQEKVKWLKKQNFKDTPFLIIAILTHGGRNEMVSAKDGDYSINDHFLFEIIENPTLAKKPKIFIIQACKGAEIPTVYYDSVVSVAQKSPQEVLKLHSTFEGFAAVRYENGSPFISSLCQHIKNYGRYKDLLEIMMSVTADVQARVRQVPSISSTLTQKFVLGNY